MPEITPFVLKGVVKPFRGDGRKLGYPTANIEIHEDTAEGVFFGTVTVRGDTHNASIFIGSAVTMNDPVKRAEAHILDFPDEDLYDEPIVFRVEYKHRDNEKYPSPAELVDALRADDLAARQYFSNAPKR